MQSGSLARHPQSLPYVHDPLLPPSPSRSTLHRSVMPAPAPRNVNWSALFRSWVGRGVRPMPVFVAVLVMLLIPIGLFAGEGLGV